MTLLKLAFKGVKAHPSRLFLTGLAVLVGVSFVAASFIIADSLSSLFGDLTEDANAGIDATVRPIPEDFGTFVPLDDSLVAEVAALPEVGQALPFVTPGEVFNPFVALDGDGEEVVPVGPPIVTFSWDGVLDGSSLELIDGRPGASIDEVVIDVNYAEALEAALGDTILFNTPDGQRSFTLVGLVNFEASAGAYFVLFDFPSAQQLFDKVGQTDAISVAAADGYNEFEAVTAIAPLLDERTEVIGQSVIIDEGKEDFGQIIGIFRNILLGFAVIALFVSLFIIYNTFAILVSQRTREFGLLRSIGATSGQILTSVMLEALLIGLVASLLGIGGGVLVAMGIKAIFAAAGGFPETETIITAQTVAIAIACGVGATTISALLPAYGAGSLSPVAAMRNEPGKQASLSIRIALGAAITVAGLALVGVGLFALSTTVQVIAALGAGAVLTFLGVAALSVLFGTPIVTAIGSGLGRKLITMFLIIGGTALTIVSIGRVLDGSVLSAGSAIVGVIALAAGVFLASNAFSQNQLAGHLAQQNAARSPRRTAATATALMIGLALVTTVSVMGESLKASFIDSTDTTIRADVFIYHETAGGQGSISTDLADEIAQMDGVEQMSRFRVGDVRLENEDVLALAAWDAVTDGDLLNFEADEGSAASLDANSMLVYTQALTDRGWAVGDEIDIEFEDGKHQTMKIAGEFTYNQVLNSPSIIVDLPVHAAHYPDADDSILTFNVAESADFDAVVQAAKDESGQYPNIVAVDQEEFQETASGQIDGMIALINALLGLTLVVAMLGIVNTVALSVTERTREIGLMRAVGMTRKQLARSIRWEAVMVCIFGAILGIVLGVLFAYAAVQAIPDGILTRTAIPYQTIGTIIMLSAVIGVLSAVIPAYFAGRKDVLAAIASE